MTAYQPAGPFFFMKIPSFKKFPVFLCALFGLLGTCVPSYCYEDGKAEAAKTREMTLTDCVFLALRNNRDIRSAHLDRVVQKFDLRVAEDEFVPDLTINPSVKHKSTGDGQNRSYTNQGAISATVSQKLKTGAELAFIWSDSADRAIDGNTPADTYNSSWNITFRQPLLKGGGITVNMIPLESARITEQNNILSLKSTIINTITSAINAYRSFFQARKQLEISRNSVKRAKDLLEVNKALIQAGRMAKVEIVQTQADVADKEFSLTQSRNSVDAARYSLLKVLDIDKHTMVIPTEKIQIKAIKPDLERCKALALKARPDYLQALLNMKTTDLELVAAKNNYLWDLSLEGAYGISATDSLQRRNAWKRISNSNRSDWEVGVSLSIPFGDLTRKQRVLRAQTSVKKARMRLNELTENIEIEVIDAVRDVEMKLTQVGFARQARELTARKLEIEKEKLKAGRSSNFQLVTFQNDLINSQNNELNATINYLNALAALDRTLGTTLDTWKIDIEKVKED